MVLVTFTDRASLARYRAANDLPFQTLVDPDRAAYRAFGLGRGSLGRVWGWRAGLRYLQLFRATGLAGVRRVHRPVEDTRQLGGDFVVGPDGVLTWGFWGQGPDDRPSVDELVDAVARTVG